MLTCKDVSHDLSADIHRTGGLRRRLAIRLHLLMCENCRRFASQLRQVQLAMQELCDAGGHEIRDEQAEHRILDRVRDSISKG